MTLFGASAALEVGLIALAVGTLFSLVNKKVVDQKKMKRIKKEISDFQKEYNEAKKRGNQEEINKLEAEQKRMMGLTKDMFIGSMKPMMYTFIPAIVVLFGMSSVYGGLGNIVTLPMLGWELNWLWWYILVSVITGISVEIIYKIYTRSKESE